MMKAGTRTGVLVGGLLLTQPLCLLGQLANPEFEQVEPDGRPTGWTVYADLDNARYRPPQYDFMFDAVEPVIASPGRRGTGHALAFPAEGTWRCEVVEHDSPQADGRPDPLPGQKRGKAAACQVVHLKPGCYHFGAFLRTADGDPWSAAFSLGVAVNGTTQYAHDDSTGIQWTSHDLAMRGDPHGDYFAWGEWQWHATEPFEVIGGRAVSVWIRFNYVNRHQTVARWEVDDAAIIPAGTEPFAPRAIGLPTDDPIADFQMELDIAPRHNWRRLTIRFRESADARDGFILTIHRDGRTELASCRDGRIHAQEESPLTRPSHCRLVARNQYLRVDLPGEAGFEARITGQKTGRLVLDVDPPDSAGIQAVLTTAPPDLPALPVPVAGTFEAAYDPSVGEEGKWYINDHCVLQNGEGVWHLFGITHPEPASPLDEDFFAHAVTPDLMRFPWQKRPPVCHVNTAAGETHVWAPHVVERDGTYYMFYCGGGRDSDAYQINLRTSTDLAHWEWHPGNPLFTDIGDARDPMVVELDDGRYLMYYTRPSDLVEQWSAVAFRESSDLLQWSEARIALRAHVRNRFGRATESPFVFRNEGTGPACGPAYYLSATGIGGYRGTLVWRSVNPRRFDADHVVTRIDAHAPEWITARPGPPTHVTHCGWGQGGFHIAPVRWESRPWRPFGLLVVRDAKAGGGKPTHIAVSRPGSTDPYRTFSVRRDVAAYALPPGRYHVSAQRAAGASFGPLRIEIAADERTEIDLP